jgi:hypothetical protein
MDKMTRNRLLTTLVTASLGLFAAGASAADAPASGFTFHDVPNGHLDVLLDGKLVARYMDAHDTSTKERRVETYKPYLQVYDAEGKEPITQGAGGKQFPHHRGIYIGWQKLGYEGKKCNFWEMASGDIVHEKFAAQKADADGATFTSLTRWVLTGSERPVIEEERTMTVRRAPAPARLVIDFSTKLKAPNGDVDLNGDPEHGGVQYRPGGDIAVDKTVYVYPKAGADPHKDTDYPWVGETYSLRGKTYSVIEMSAPTNPEGTRWSAYRPYGRFGAFPHAALKSGGSLTLKYRFVVAEGEMPPAEFIEKQYDQFTGAAAPSAVPQVTVKKAEPDKAPSTKPAAKPKAAAAAK